MSEGLIPPSARALPRAIAVASLLAVIASSAPLAQAQNRFRFTNLGVLGGGDQSTAAAVNASGQVAGSSNQTAGGNHLATRYTGSAWQLAGAGVLAGYTGSTVGLAINAAGHLAGNSNTGPPNSTDQAFFWNGSGALVALGFLPPSGTISQGIGINDSDVVTGRSSTVGGASSSNHPFAWSSGSLTDLGLPTGWSRALGQGINNAGLVVGYGRPTTGPPGNRPFVYAPGSPGTFQVLPVDFGGDFSTGRAINVLGHVVGYSDVTAAGPTTGFLWNGVTAIPIPHLPGATSAQPLGLNDLDHVVGIDGSAVFLYSGGTTYDLSTLVAAGSPFSGLAQATGINIHGQISGNGTLTAGGSRGFLATPELNRTGGTGAWAASNGWSWGLTPAWCHPVAVNGSVTVTGPLVATKIAELGVGLTSGPATLALAAGVLTVTKVSSPVSAAWATGISTVGANGKLRFDLTAPTTARIVTDSLTLAPGSTVDFTGAGAQLSYVLISYTGSLSGTFTNVTNLPATHSVIYDPALKQVRADKTSPVELVTFDVE